MKSHRSNAESLRTPWIFISRMQNPRPAKLYFLPSTTRWRWKPEERTARAWLLSQPYSRQNAIFRPGSPREGSWERSEKQLCQSWFSPDSNCWLSLRPINAHLKGILWGGVDLRISGPRQILEDFVCLKALVMVCVGGGGPFFFSLFKTSYICSFIVNTRGGQRTTFWRVGPQDWIQVTRLGSNCLFLLSHLDIHPQTPHFSSKLAYIESLSEQKYIKYFKFIISLDLYPLVALLWLRRWGNWGLRRGSEHHQWRWMPVWSLSKACKLKSLWSGSCQWN